MFTVKDIQLDYMDKAEGVVRFPTISWVIDTDEQVFVQTGYELEAAADPAFQKLLWSSGRQLSAQSVGITVDCDVVSACRYFVRVRVQYGDNWSDWSMAKSFFTGLVANEWQQIFISAETEADAADSRGTCLRHTFELSKPVAQAYAYTTALGLYQFFLNGKKVGCDELTPGWTAYDKRLSYQAYDVTEQLKSGKNVMGAQLGAGWYKGMMTFEHQRNFYGRQTAFLAELHVRYTDGSEAVFGTDESWQGSDSPVLFAEIYGGETYDARLEQAGWSAPDFAAQGWRAVSKVDYDKMRLVPQPASRVRITDTLPVQRFLTTPKGERVLDFGQNMAGWTAFKVRGKAGMTVKLHCFEVLDQAGNVYLENLRDADQTITYTKGTDQEEYFQPHFTYQGFQFVWLEVWPSDAAAADFTAYTLQSDLPETGHFECSAPLLNQLQHNIRWGLKGNFLEVPTDCPQRDERLGWTGDAEIFSSTANFLVNTHAFYSKWLLDLAAEQNAAGAVPHVVPDVLTPTASQDMIDHMGMDGASGWADAAVIVPWNLYLSTGDEGILRRQYDSMKAWVSFMAAHTDADGIFSYKMQFGDWLALDGDPQTPLGATPTPLTCSIYNIVSTRIVAKTARILGNRLEAEIYDRRLENLIGHFRQNYFTDEGLLKVDTQTAYAMVLAYGLAEDGQRPALAARLAALIERDGGHLVTGFMGTPCLCQALTENGQAEAAWKLLLREEFPGWLYPVKMGATTIWEHWDGLRPDGSFCDPKMNSFNHYAYGAIGDWLYRFAAGLDIDEDKPGYQNIKFQPQPGGGLSYAEASHMTPYGRAAIRWEQSDQLVTVTLVVPANATAVLRLVNVQELIETDGLLFTDDQADLGSGSYRVVYRCQ